MSLNRLIAVNTQIITSNANVHTRVIEFRDTLSCLFCLVESPAVAAGPKAETALGRFQKGASSFGH